MDKNKDLIKTSALSIRGKISLETYFLRDVKDKTKTWVKSANEIASNQENLTEGKTIWLIGEDKWL